MTNRNKEFMNAVWPWKRISGEIMSVAAQTKSAVHQLCADPPPSIKPKATLGQARNAAIVTVSFTQHFRLKAQHWERREQRYRPIHSTAPVRKMATTAASSK